VRASSQISSVKKPANAISLAADGTVWSPAIRTGYGWKQYLEFDFLTQARITKLVVGKPADFRTAKKVLVQVGDGPDNYRDVKEADTISPILFDAPILTRYMRVIILETNNEAGAADQIPLAVSG
jgi:hypothetical protein